MTVGDRDLLLGQDVLRGLKKLAKFPIVATNLVDKVTKKPVFATSTVVTAAGLKIGVVGLMGSNARLPAESRFAVLPAVDAAKPAIASLEATGVDLLVVLSHLTDPEERKLAQAYPQLDAILGGGTVKMARQISKVGTTFIANAYSKGKQLSILRFNIHDGKKPGGFVDRYQNQALTQKVQEVDSRLKRYEAILKRQVSTPSAGARRPNPSSQKDFYAKQVTKLKADKQLAQMELADAPAVDPGANFIQFDLIPLAKTIEHEPTIEQAVVEFRKKVPKLDAKRSRLSPRGTGPVRSRVPQTIPAKPVHKK